MDDGKTERCPFDSNHIIRTCKFEYHLLKCNSPNRKEFAVCPFNARHYVKRNGLRTHMVNCSDRNRLVKEINISEMKMEDVNDSSSDNFSSLTSSNQIDWGNDEDWGADLKSRNPINTVANRDHHYSYANKADRKEARSRLAEKHKTDLKRINE